MREIIISGKEANQRLDKFLAKYMDLAPKSFFYKMLRKKNITLNGKKATGNEKLIAGDQVKLFLSEETIEKFITKRTAPKKVNHHNKLDVIYEDDHVLIINKPVGVLSQKASKTDISLVEYIADYLFASQALTEEDLRSFKPGVCNRLDRNTSGLITAGKTLQGLQELSQAFKQRSLKKYYRCIVKGEIASPSYINGYLVKNEKKNKVYISDTNKGEGIRIETEYKPLAVKNGYTYLEVHLITGKTHQIRAHLSSIGHPLIGDYKYGDKKVNDLIKKKFKIDYQLLHAYRLEFPMEKGALSALSEKKLIAPLPNKFEKILHEMIGE